MASLSSFTYSLCYKGRSLSTQEGRGGTAKMRGTAMGTAERKEMQRDGELMGETRISRTIIVIVQTVLPTTMLLENHLAYKQHDASILQIFLRWRG